MNSKITEFFDSSKNCVSLRKKDLKKSPNLKKTFNLINQHLYGKLKHTHTDTRSRSKEIINLLFCKLVDEINKCDNDFLDFCINHNETEQELFERIQLFFKKQVKERYEDIFENNEQINLDKKSLYLIVKEIQGISLLNSSKDILSDAFEIFVSKILKDEAGQYFTPPNIIKFMVNYLNPDIDANLKFLDPACGHGGFLLEVKDLLWSKLEQKYNNQEDIINKKKSDLISNLYGIDKDLFLAKICKLYLEILSNGKSKIFCENSLDPNSYRADAKKAITESSFDYIFTNPPFGAKIPIEDQDILKNFELGHFWTNINGTKWIMDTKLVKQQPPQILFIERCIQLLKDGGKLGIILPEGIFGNPTDKYIWEFLEKKGKILGVISLDQNSFQPFTCNKTSILFFQKINIIPNDYLIDFAIIENVGHDKDGKISYKLNKDGSIKKDPNGNSIINDDLLDLDVKLKNAELLNYLRDQKIFKINFSQIKNKNYIPSYYTGIERTLQLLSNNKDFTLITIGDLTKKSIIYTNKNGYLPRGDEIGSNLYGLGEIPFIRTSEIYNWEINLDSNKKTSEEVYNQYKNKQNIETGDILLVKDGGPNLIGKTALITELDNKIIIQSHIYQIKVLKNNEFIDCYLLLYLLNLDIVQKQIQAITFVQGTIASIGNRILEVNIPIPADINKRKEISQYIKKIIDDKKEIKFKIRNLNLDSFFN